MDKVSNFRLCIQINLINILKIFGQNLQPDIKEQWKIPYMIHKISKYTNKTAHFDNVLYRFLMIIYFKSIIKTYCIYECEKIDRGIFILYECAYSYFTIRSKL